MNAPRFIKDAVCQRCGTVGLWYDRRGDVVRCPCCRKVEYDFADAYRAETHRRGAA